MSLYDDLLTQAETLAGLDRSKPKQANLRRAVSAAYYALFHFLVDEGCRQVLGTRQSTTAFRRIVARAFDHGSMRGACDAFSRGQFPRGVTRSLPSGFAVPIDLADVAQSFIELQEQRHLGDYDLGTTFDREGVRSQIEQAERAIETFSRLSDETMKQFFLSCLLTWKNLGGRP